MTFHAAWRETIKAHLAFEPSETLSAITAYEACYTRSFVDFAREALAPAIPKDQIPSPSGSDKEARERIAAT